MNQREVFSGGLVFGFVFRRSLLRMTSMRLRILSFLFQYPILRNPGMWRSYSATPRMPALQSAWAAVIFLLRRRPGLRGGNNWRRNVFTRLTRCRRLNREKFFAISAPYAAAAAFAWRNSSGSGTRLPLVRIPQRAWRLFESILKQENYGESPQIAVAWVAKASNQ